MRHILSAGLALIVLVAPAAVGATEGLSGATVAVAGSGDGGDRRARFEEWCRSDPSKCEELRARRAERREQCRAKLEQCRAERQARFNERFTRADADGMVRSRVPRPKKKCRALPDALMRSMPIKTTA